MMLTKIGRRVLCIKINPYIFRSLSILQESEPNSDKGALGNSFKLQDEDYDKFLNLVARSREPSLIRRITYIQSIASPNTINIGGGLPNASKFPFKDAVFNLKSGERLVLDEKHLTTAQQYGPTNGYGPLVEQAKELVLRYHNPPNFENSKVVMTAGCQDGFSRTLEMVLSPGDYVIVEDPTFCGALSVIRPHRVNILGVKSDAHGMIPECLSELLSRWSPEEVRDAQQGVPKAIYVNPIANNPSGVSLITERKKEIYEIARTYNLLILEDDPYFFLQFEDEKTFPQSFLSMDTDGRVMRFDSFSKIICSGLRVGYLTGPHRLVDKFIEHSEITVLHPSSLSQVIISELLKSWSFEGFENHIHSLRKFYLGQREALNTAVKKHLSGLCEWNIPTGGMFLWLKVLVLDDTTEMAMNRGLQKELILMPGNSFMADDKKPCPYLRLSYSFTTPEAMDEACRRLAELILEEVEICSKREKKIII